MCRPCLLGHYSFERVSGSAIDEVLLQVPACCLYCYAIDGMNVLPNVRDHRFLIGRYESVAIQRLLQASSQ